MSDPFKCPDCGSEAVGHLRKHAEDCPDVLARRIRRYEQRWQPFSNVELDEIFDGLTRDPASGRSCAVMQKYSPVQYGIVAGVVAEIDRRGKDPRPYETALVPLGEE